MRRCSNLDRAADVLNCIPIWDGLWDSFGVRERSRTSPLLAPPAAIAAHAQRTNRITRLSICPARKILRQWERSHRRVIPAVESRTCARVPVGPGEGGPDPRVKRSGSKKDSTVQYELGDHLVWSWGRCRARLIKRCHSEIHFRYSHFG